ncbi:MAG: hypothetical protein JKY37_21395 [Nannocystaceae bacterium]|nr:hypothetical protein [Nannocystaceae bacterium]
MSVATRMRCGRVGLVLAFAALVPSTACNEPETDYLARYELDGLEVFAYDFDRVCRGLLDELEVENRRIRDVIGAQDDRTLPVLLGESIVDERCLQAGNVIGCIKASEDRVVVVASPRALAHELVHAYRWRRTDWRKPPFLEEGIADVVSIGLLKGLSTLSSRTLDLRDAFTIPVDDLTEFLRRDATHFVYWMFQEYGQDATIAMFSDPDPDVEAVLQKHFDADLETLRQRWHDGTEEEIRMSTACDGVPLYELSDEPLVIELDTACDAPGVGGPSLENGVPSSFRTFCVEVAGVVGARLALQSEGGPADLVLRPRLDECVFDPDNPSSEYEKRVLSGDSEDIVLGGCTWIGRIESEVEQASIVRVTITPL